MGRKSAFLISLMVLTWIGGYAQTLYPARRCVLLLYSYSRQIPWQAHVGAGIDTALDRIPLQDQPFIFEENLDAARVGDPRDFETLSRWLLSKYARIEFDAVISEGQQAAAFLLRYPDLFPTAERYLYHFASTASLPKAADREYRFESVTDLETAVRLLPRLLPDLKRIVVVNDQSLLGLARDEQLRSLAASLAPAIRVEIWNEFTQSELLERSAGLGREDALFYLPVQQDRTGAPLVPGLVCQRLCVASAVPVFSHFDSLLGSGIVGGYLVSANLVGDCIGSTAASGRGGAPVDQEAYGRAIMSYQFDVRQLRRWNIDARLLPDKSKLLFDEPGFWAKNGWPILIGSIVFLAESLLILALLQALAQRKRAIGLLAAERSGLEAKVLLRTADLQEANRILNIEVEERRKAEERERAISAEKVTLLRELQHRVKNNLSVIAGLLALEGDRAEAPQTREAMDSMSSRVQALATLYDILYTSGTLQEIALPDYLRRLAASIAEALGADMKGIRLDLNIESCSLDTKRAVSLGLIVNELLTDSLKYAFPDSRTGCIRIDMHRADGRLLLELTDDGVGLPAHFDPAAGSGFGLKLVRLLAQQHKADFSMGPSGEGNGTRFQLSFPCDQAP